MPFDIHEDPNYDELVHLVRSKECVAFIGSGLSTDHYLSWDRLIYRLCEECGVPIPNDDHEVDVLLQSADDAHDSNQAAYLSVLTQEFGKPNVNTRMAYDLLMRLPFRSYVTPNFDPLLALAGRRLTGSVNPRVYAYPSVPAPRLHDKNVFYIHGFVERGGTVNDGDLVLSRRDFEAAYSHGLEGFLEQLFTYLPLFFVGCSLREPAVQKTFQKAREFRKLIESQHSVPAPARFILLPIALRPDSQGALVSLTALGERDFEFEAKEERRFEEMDITVVRYDPLDQQHSGIEAILEEWNDLSPVKSASPFLGGDHP